MAFSLQDYEILTTIGQGGFGTILKARQKALGKIVAIKSLAAQRTLSQKDIVRFRTEAEAMAVLSHDNIIAVFDYAYFGANYYIVMEYVDGMTFEHAFEMKIPFPLSLLIMEKVISGLKFAHSEKIFHRDIKPSNILLGKQGQVKLADFGLASFRPDVTRFSTSTAVIGTFCYMAPEAMVNPKEVDYRVDIFSTGCILYRALSGQLPFPGSTVGEVSYNVLNKEPDSIQVDEKYSELLKLIYKSLKKDREKRPTLDEIHSSIQNAITNQYHSSLEDLKAFICNEKPKIEQTTPASSLVASEHSRKKPRLRSLFRYTVIIGIIALFTAGFFIAQNLFRNKRPVQTNLPAVTIIQQQQSNIVSGTTPFTDTSIKLSDENPKPLTGTSPDMTSGALVIKGVSRKDTILINDRIIDNKVKKGQQKISLQSGHYTVEIYRHDKKRIHRKVRVMPYQIFILDLDDERNSNGR